MPYFFRLIDRLTNSIVDCINVHHAVSLQINANTPSNAVSTQPYCFM